MSSTTILLIILAILSVDFLLNRVLSALNIRQLKATMPPGWSFVYTEKKYKTFYAYTREHAGLGMMRAFSSFLFLFAVLATGTLGKLDQWIASQVQNEYWQTVIFFGILMFASEIISLPFQLYSTFGIESKYDFNRTTIKTFCIDKVKSYVLTALLGMGLIWLFRYFVTLWEKEFWLYFWVVAITLLLLLQVFFTSVILPLFNKLSPLEEGSLKQAIREYAQKVGFPLQNIYVMDGSKRSRKSNAFFSGLGKRKKIVLFDTLIEQMSQDEILAVLAHEVGHYKKKHIVLTITSSILQLGLTLFVLSLFIFSPNLSAALGGSEPSLQLNLFAFALLYSPFSTAIAIVMNIFSRKHEYEADAYAAETHDASSLRSALIKLHRENLSNLEPHPAYVFVHYSHPTLLHRLNAIPTQVETAYIENVS